MDNLTDLGVKTTGKIQSLIDRKLISRHKIAENLGISDYKLNKRLCDNNWKIDEIKKINELL